MQKSQLQACLKSLFVSDANFMIFFEKSFKNVSLVCENNKKYQKNYKSFPDFNFFYLVTSWLNSSLIDITHKHPHNFPLFYSHQKMYKWRNLLMKKNEIFCAQANLIMLNLWFNSNFSFKKEMKIKQIKSFCSPVREVLRFFFMVLYFYGGEEN